ncbi:MAG: hypothetical protein Harvfovirus9_19 [Harvfovirus sp.]|uniref:Uncharacterized protein n=1 Tax=Harvfovirus sp. TaxID=2487768 RepID=A0A3G5A5X9_9VIRU|nr:MAG: hypothetical protein Harvfovirus9_19 [Harvfovirus sp.]
MYIRYHSMFEIKLEGFVINSHPYVIPIYSYTCPCRIKVYLSDFSRYVNALIFRPKFYKKYAQLAIENMKDHAEFEERIPHVDLRDELKNMCESHLIDTSPAHSLLYQPAYKYYKYIAYCTSENMSLLYKLLLESDNLEIGYWIGSFAINYWATCHYNWYSVKNFNASSEEKKRYIADAGETNLLIKIKLDEQILFDEINKGLASTNIISPLVNIIVEYNCPPLHLMGKLIEKFKSDIEKYVARE